MLIESQHPILAAVEVEKTSLPVNGKAAWVGNSIIGAEGSEWRSGQVEGK